MGNISPISSSDDYGSKDLEVAKEVYEVPSSSSNTSIRLGETDGGVFATGGNIDAYKPIEKYEGAHRYDPLFEWTEKEEKKLIRRVCTKSITIFFLSFFFFVVTVCVPMPSQPFSLIGGDYIDKLTWQTGWRF